MSSALAQTLAELAVALIGFVGSMFLGWLRSHIKNQQAYDVLSHALENALGAAQNAAQQGIKSYSSDTPLSAGNVPPALRPAFTYMMNHAGDEMLRLGITEEAMVEKLQARLGRLNIASNVGTAASTGATAAPLAPVVSETSPV